jgi:hypothetical protein
MSLADIRAQLKSILESVEGIGKVHDYQRWTKDWKKFLELFKDGDNKLNGWIITLGDTNEALYVATGVNMATHELLIKGYYGLKDEAESEKVFIDLIEKIRTALRSNHNLNGSCLTSDPPATLEVTHDKLGGVLVHKGVISLKVKEYIRY